MKLVAPADLMFLLLETRNSPMHVAGLNIYSPPADAAPTFVADLVTRWKRFPEARAPFNQRVVLHLGAWFWEDADDFDLDWSRFRPDSCGCARGGDSGRRR